MTVMFKIEQSAQLLHLLLSV